MYWKKGTSLPADVMQMLHDNPKVTLVFSYTYKDVPYTLTIPGSAVVLNPAVQWYGPVYLNTLYGSLSTATLPANSLPSTGTYKVKSGNTLTSIAKNNHTSIKHLKAVNNIKDPDKLKVGLLLRF